MKFAETVVNVTYDGVPYHGKVYRIEKAKLGGYDGGGTIPQVALEVSDGASHTNIIMKFVGRDVDPEGGRYGSGDYEGTAYGMDLVLRVLHITKSADWSQVAGKYIIPLWRSNNRIGAGFDCVGFKALQSEMEDMILIFEDHARKFREKETN